MTPDELPAYLRRVERRAKDAGEAASNGMVQAFDSGIKGNELRRFTHSAGEWTNAPAGGPPALVTGKLRNSFRIRRAVSIGGFRYRSSDGPNTIYAHIQEYGGDIFPKHTYTDASGVSHPGFLRWEAGGVSHFSRHVRLPARPYMHPAIRRMTGDGTLTRGATRAFEERMGF